MEPQKSDLPDLEKAALTYAEVLITQPAEMTDGLMTELKRHFSDDQIAELSHYILYYNWPVRFASAIRLEAEDGDNMVVRSVRTIYAPVPLPGPDPSSRE